MIIRRAIVHIQTLGNRANAVSTGMTGTWFANGNQLGPKPLPAELARASLAQPLKAALRHSGNAQLHA